MRLLPVLSVIAAFSLACAGSPCGEGTVEVDGECVADTSGDGDTGDGGADTEPFVADAFYSDEGRIVAWTIEVDGAASEGEIWLLETGAPEFEGDCRTSDIGNGGIACGVWSEHHTAFEVIGEVDGITTLRLVLDATDDLTQQESDASTLFQDPYLENVTFLVEIDGGADCAVGGDAPSALAQDCGNAL